MRKKRTNTTSRRSETGELFAEPVLHRCVELDLPCMGMGASTEIIQSPHLFNLRRLNFPDNEAGPVIESIASPPSPTCAGRTSTTAIPPRTTPASSRWRKARTSRIWNTSTSAIASSGPNASRRLRRPRTGTGSDT